mgnify:FL=1
MVMVLGQGQTNLVADCGREVVVAQELLRFGAT